MTIGGQMARVPVTAHQKFDEAAHFYNGMLAHRNNPVVFPYYLSAFVSALRSVTYYLQKQYAHDPRFQEWYTKKQVEMKAEPVLKLLHDKRNTALHVEPFDLYFRQGFKFPEKYGGVIETTHLEVTEKPDPMGEIKITLKVGKDGEVEQVEPLISWHFTEDDTKDVMNHCYDGLEKIQAVLKELVALRLEKGLPEDEEIQPHAPLDTLTD
jgi:hypothetical protein